MFPCRKKIGNVTRPPNFAVMKPFILYLAVNRVIKNHGNTLQGGDGGKNLRDFSFSNSPYPTLEVSPLAATQPKLF